MKPEFITFTGIDDRTDLTRADELAQRYPIEWGVLFARSNRDSRYPCDQAVAEIKGIAGRKSAHLCGSVAKEAVAGRIIERVPIECFKRVQVNGFHQETGNLADLQSNGHFRVIFQHRTQEFPRGSHFQHLYDLSAGEGLLPMVVPVHPGDDALVGYAGGMGPDTVVEYLERIPQEGLGKFWIDMEGRVRTNGWFDLNKVERVCDLVYG